MDEKQKEIGKKESVIVLIISFLSRSTMTGVIKHNYFITSLTHTYMEEIE